MYDILLMILAVFFTATLCFFMVSLVAMLWQLTFPKKNNYISGEKK